jgi:phosphoenolpyruvate carboxykinase (GTP)
MGERSQNLPRIYYVNWFLKNSEGKYLWPGFGENSRILKWIFERTSHAAPAELSPIGYLPKDLDVGHLEVNLKELLAVDPALWIKEVEELKSYFKLFKDRLPGAVAEELEQLSQRLSGAR